MSLASLSLISTAVTNAQALVPELHDATPEEDNEGLARLATWCLRLPAGRGGPPRWRLDRGSRPHLRGGLRRKYVRLSQMARCGGFAALTPGYGTGPILFE